MLERFFFIIIISLLFCQVGLAFGTSPASIDAGDVLVGGYADTGFLLSNTRETDILAQLNVEGPDWIVVPESVLLPARGAVRVPVTIRPPADAAAGAHEGQIIILPGENMVPGVATLSVHLSLPINVTVTTVAKTSCIVGGISVPDMEEGQPLQLLFILTNDGNTRVAPSGTYAIAGRIGSVHEGSFSFSEETLPTTRKEYLHESSLSLAQGSYTLHLDACGQETVTEFRVLAPGSLGQLGDFILLGVEEREGVRPVNATFKNDGARIVRARFSGVLEKDGRVVRILESEELLVRPGESVSLESFVSPEEAGRYEVRGSVVYEGRKTAEKSVSFEVIRNTEKNFTSIALAVAVAFILIILIIEIWLRRR